MFVGIASMNAQLSNGLVSHWPLDALDGDTTSDRLTRTNQEQPAVVDQGPYPRMEGPLGMEARRPTMEYPDLIAGGDSSQRLFDEAGR